MFPFIRDVVDATGSARLHAKHRFHTVNMHANRRILIRIILQLMAESCWKINYNFGASGAGSDWQMWLLPKREFHRTEKTTNLNIIIADVR